MDELYDKLISLSFKYLSIRSRSEKEMVDYIQKKIRVITGDTTTLYREKLINQVIERLKELDLVNDRKFAELWVTNRIRIKKKSNIILRKELKEKGISLHIISEILGSDIGEDETDRIMLLIEKKRRILKLLPRKEQKIKLYQYIVRRGFSSSKVLRIIDECLKKDYTSSY